MIKSTLILMVFIFVLVLISIFSCGETENLTQPKPSSRIIYADVVASAPTLTVSILNGEIRDIADVYDGDTLKNVFFKICQPCELIPFISEKHIRILQEGDALYYIADIRIHGIDTPEMRPLRSHHENEERRQREKALAILARDHVRKLIKNAKRVKFFITDIDKYGRLLAGVVVLSPEGIWVDVAESLINCGLAIEYDGGSKIKGYWGTAPEPKCR